MKTCVRHSSAQRLKRAFVLLAILVLFCSWSGHAALLDVRTDANGYEIIINIPARELHLYRNGVLVKTYPIGVGSVVSPSRLGTTQIINSVAHPTYYPPDWYLRGLKPIPPGPDNPVGTRWLGLGWSGYGIHGTNRPESIGTASSAGCIRMYNEDVEELATLVGPGTPVTFVYEPIEVHTDALTGRVLLRIHKDIYRAEGRNTVDILDALAARQIPTEGVSSAGLTMLLQQATGELVLLPVELPVVLGETPLPAAGFRVGSREYVSFDRLVGRLQDVLGLPSSATGSVLDDIAARHMAEVDGERFIDPGSLGTALGLDWEYTVAADGSRGVRFHFTRVQYGDVTLPWRVHREHTWILLPVAEFAALYGIDVDIDAGREIVYVDGRPVFGGRTIEGMLFLPHDRLASLFGVAIDWDQEAMVVTLEVKE